MTWIKMRTDLPEDPDVIAMANILGGIDLSNEERVLAKLHRIWSWADAQTADGNAPSVTSVWLDAYVGAPGFTKAMAEVGWLDITNTGVAFPNFDVHMSESAKTRAVTAKRVAKSRRKKRNGTSVTREEKRREDTKTPTESVLTGVDNGNKTKKRKRKLFHYCPAFEAWWATYPKSRRIDKKKTHDEWKRAGKRLKDEHDWTSEEAATHLQQRVEAYAASPAAQRVKFVLHSHRWLTNSRYDDDATAWLEGQQTIDGPAEATGEYAS